MATLTGSTIASTYDRLLALPSGGLNGATLVAITDGNASATCALQVSTTSIAIGATHKLGFDGTDTGTRIAETADGILSFYADNVAMLALDEENGETVFNDGSADIDFRVESNAAMGGLATHALFVSGQYGTLNIGSSTEGMTGGILVEHAHTTTIANTNEFSHFGLVIRNKTNTLNAFTGIAFDVCGATADSDEIGAAIYAVSLSATEAQQDCELAFATNNANTDGMYERMRITQDGNVGIGTAAPGALLDIKATDSTTCLILRDQDSAGDSNYIELYESNDDKAWELRKFNDVADSDADAGIGFRNAANANVLALTQAGEVGIGTNAPTAHLQIKDATADSSLYPSQNVLGLIIDHTITGGDSDSANSHAGIENKLYFNDDGESFGALYGIISECGSTATADEDNNGFIMGIYNTTSMAGEHSDVDNIWGINNVVDLNAGTVDANVYGMVTSLDIESAVTAITHIYGHAVKIDTAENPSGTCILNHWVMTGAGTEDGDFMMYAYDTRNTDVVAHMTMTGTLTVDSSAADGASDYAEWFESKDGVAIEIGSTVKLDNGKIVSCEEGDIPMGVVRPADALVVQAGGRKLKWQGKYVTDDYGSHIYEDCEWVMWKEAVDFDEYNQRHNHEESPKYEKVSGIDGAPDTYHKEYSFYADRVPDGLKIPVDAEIIQAQPRKKQNPDYDPSREYVSREDRDEWYLVGLLGQIPITKGQPVGSWTKMYEISDSVDMYYAFPQANNNQQGDSSNEQEQESADSGDSGGDASSESSGEDSGGVEAGSSDSSDSASGASEASESSSDDGDESSGGSGSDSSDDSEGGSGEDDSEGIYPDGEPSAEWTKNQLKEYMIDNVIAFNSGDTKQDLLDKIILAGESPDED